MNIENTNRDCVMVWVRGFLDTSLQRFGQVKTKHQNLNKLFCENGFTLAEVLITLGIIGIVAAMTIPTLIQNYQTKQYNIASSNFEARFGEALRVMNTQQNLVNLGTTEKFVEELQKNMSIIKTCDNTKLSECFPQNINGSVSVVNLTDETTYDNDENSPTNSNSLKTAKTLGKKDWGTNSMGIQFANGVSAILAYNPKCSASPFDNNAVVISGDKENVKFGTDCVSMIYDTSGFANPNIKDKDIRTSNATIGDTGCAFKIGDACIPELGYVAPAIPKSECETLKGELGIKACNTDVDYWAGAVKYCGGVNNMLTSSELDAIANYVYQNNDRATKLGGLSRYTYIWGGSEYTGNYSTFAEMRRFLVVGYFGHPADNGNWGDRARSQSGYKTFCKKQ